MAGLDIFSSFRLTEKEVADNTKHVNNLIRRSSELLDRYEAKSSLFDLDDASAAIDEAVNLARFPGACESPPLAKCYLTQGHIFSAMGRCPEARIAYVNAANIPPLNTLERAASKLGTSYAKKMDHKVQDSKRKGGVWPDIYHGPSATNPLQSPDHFVSEDTNEVGIIHKTSCAKKPLIKSSRAQNLQRPRNLIRCNEGCMKEAISSPSFDRRGMLTPTSPMRSYREHLAVRNMKPL
ncbi:hypothetical protein F5B19DRAFT_254102 [Rostrohypoxylon terebratum]|nr:hypothetical protein F5B19DRAFT_254102 [Rostrohypoxylon terebratum]